MFFSQLNLIGKIRPNVRNVNISIMARLISVI